MELFTVVVGSSVAIVGTWMCVLLQRISEVLVDLDLLRLDEPRFGMSIESDPDTNGWPS